MKKSDGPTVEEVIARLHADRGVIFEWRCTPTDLVALAVGRLYIEGMIRNADVAARIDIVRVEDGDVDITLPGRMQVREMMRDEVIEPLPTADVFGDLFRALFAATDERYESGGMHAAALARGARIAYQAEDVGRHNAIDKVVGMALLGREDPAHYGMLVSSRVSGEIARKAARAGVAWLASRSIPTTLAVRVAHEASMPLVGRAAGKGAFVY